MRNPRSRLGPVGHHHWAGFIRVYTTQDRAFHIHRDTLQAYLPYTQDWGCLTLPTEIDDPDLGDENIKRAWDLLVWHLYYADKNVPGSSLVDNIQHWMTEQGGATAAQDFDGTLSLPLTIRALGLILNYFSCSAIMLAPLQQLLNWILHPPPCRDPYIFAVILSTICEISEDDPSRLQGAVGIIQSTPDAEDSVRFALNDPYCQYFSPLSYDLLRALEIRAGQAPAHWPQPLWHRQGHRRAKSMYRMLPSLQPLPPSPTLLAPPILRRPQMPARSKSLPGIRGHHLPPGLLMRVAMAYPERVKVDSRVLFSNPRSAGFAAIAASRWLTQD